MQVILKLLAAVFFAAASSLAYSQAEIVDSVPMGETSSIKPMPQQEITTPSADATAQSELYYQVQMLQQEVQKLRGLVEEQAHQLRRLKQQQLDDYVDLDRRVSGLSKSKGSSAGGASVSVPNAVVTPANAAATDTSAQKLSAETEYADYKKALRLILQDKRLEAGAQAMQAYLSQYPDGVYISNAQYWLGQVAFSSDDLSGAQKWFGAVLKNPESQKAPEAKYKLGVVLHRLGDEAAAKKILADAANSQSSAGRLAQEYLRSNF